MSALRVRFQKPARLSPDATLALEDFAHAAASVAAAAEEDEAGRIAGLAFASATPLPATVVQDIERFFDSLASDTADRLGWS